ncbi:MAG: hypothetical protein JWL64_1682 [Frankiales bacterium]|nr:hypothetical protein [Frankiales bacterium]
MKVDAALLEILACPADRSPLRVDASALDGAGALVCTSCGLQFPVRDEIPVLLLDEAVPGPSATA